MAPLFEDRYWRSEDGLRLHFRAYPARSGAAAIPVLCLHGLTRNARDFSDLAEHISEKRRVLVPEMRGRGESEYAADAATYTPKQYVADVRRLLAQEDIARVIVIGTSMGGLMAMIAALNDPSLIVAAVLNDIGPIIDPGGLGRIRGYVGQGRSYASWMHAARALQAVHGDAHPTFDLEDWLAMAKRGMAVQQSGRIGFDYDMKIAEAFVQHDGAAPPDLWPALEALHGRPVLIVRGALSDLLSPDTLDAMLERLPEATAVTVPDMGHAPLLTEPDVRDAIDAMLAAQP